MQLYPTRSTFHVAVASLGMITLGAAARLAPVVAFGGAMLLAVAVGRAAARMGIGRLRAAGFEMVWLETARVHRIARGSVVVLRGEIRNRADRRARAAGLRPIASSFLEASVEPSVIHLAPGSRAFVEVTVRGTRVGRWGVHGLALEVSTTPIGAEGLYDVPLLFANPLGIEVVPAKLAHFAGSPQGGRGRRAEVGRRGRTAGRGDELRELRDHAPGDAFKRIAWKASARRGRLLVRETDNEEHGVVWLIVDCSVELWAGTAGAAPLDRVVDEVATTAARHLGRGEQVGLVVTASRLRAWIEPDAGSAHGAILAAALASASSFIDADRSALDEEGIARRVAEHARPLDPRGLSDVSARSLDALAARAEQLRASAPFGPRLPFAPTPREQSLRHYMASFGIESPPRLEGEREKSDVAIAQVFERLASERSTGSLVSVWAPAPATPGTMAKPLLALRRQGVHVRWRTPRIDMGLHPDGEDDRSPFDDAIEDAVMFRADAARERGARVLRRMGVRVVDPRGALRLRPKVKGAP